MPRTLDLGRRIELHSMDKHCQGISIGLYRQIVDGETQLLVHSYSSLPDAAGRVTFLRQALITMVGLQPVAPDSDWLRFSCGQQHQRALKRSFLDLCKLASDTKLEPKPLVGFDKKADGNLEVSSLGKGQYQTRSEDATEVATRRAGALAKGYAKICEMDADPDQENTIRFACGTSHDELMGLLMFRAQNVRAAMQEEEQAAGKGMLAPPSQQ